MIKDLLIGSEKCFQQCRVIDHSIRMRVYLCSGFRFLTELESHFSLKSESRPSSPQGQLGRRPTSPGPFACTPRPATPPPCRGCQREKRRPPFGHQAGEKLPEKEINDSEHAGFPGRHRAASLTGVVVAVMRRRWPGEAVAGVAG